MWINRNYINLIASYLKQFPAVVITGARQVGKTSLLQHNFPNYSYVSFDDPLVAEEAKTSPDSFFGKYQEPLIIDEVQYVPEIFRYLKTLIDKSKKKGRFILTGSQSFQLMSGISESLSGRIGLIHLPGLSGRELETNSKIKYDALKLLLRGSYPEPLTKSKIDTQAWYSSYIATYLERDVRNIMNISKLRDFSIFLKSVAIRSGQILSYSELSRDIGVAVNTVKEWVSVLETSQIIYLLKPYFRNQGKRLIKSPKLYMKDTGLICYLAGIYDLKSLENSILKGAIWETYVLNQILASYYEKGLEPNIWFYRDQVGTEIDFLIDEGLNLTALEVKFSENPDISKIKKNYEVLKRHYGEDQVKKLIIKANVKQEFKLAKDIYLSSGWIC